jgi:hypothetical protein
MIDFRSEMEHEFGVIREETAIAYLGYKAAMDKFQMGFEKQRKTLTRSGTLSM